METCQGLHQGIGRGMGSPQEGVIQFARSLCPRGWLPSLFGYTALCLFSTGFAYGQYSSNLAGYVSDPSGAVVPGATVQIKNVATQVSKETTTDSGGNYTFNSLAPGQYQVTVTAKGFATAVVNVALLTGQTVNLPLRVSLASATQRVQVTEQAPVLDTADSRLQATIGTQELHSLPLQGQNFMGLASVTPGVTGLGVIVGTAPGSCSSGLPSTIPDNFATELPVEASANGETLLSNMFVLDGLDVTSNIDGGNINLTPNPGSVQEVTTETNDYSVEYGRNSSIIIKMTTKSGADQYHGSIGDFFTDQHLWARSEFTGPAYAPFLSNNLYGDIGGPIIPHRHTYFFFSVEPLRSTFSTGNQAYTFEDPQFVQWAKQNFPTGLGTKLLSSYPIKTSASGVVAETARDIFPGTCGTAATANLPCNLPMIDSGTYAASPYRNAVQWNTRIDTYFGKDRLYGNFYRMTHNDQTPSVRTGFDSKARYTSSSLQVNETHTFGARALNEAMFGYIRPEGIFGLSGLYSVPTISVVGMGAGFGVGFAQGDFIQHNYRWRDVLTMVRGTHTLKFGYDGWHGDDLAIFAPPYSIPSFQFNNLLELVQDNAYSETNLAYDPLTGQPAKGNYLYAKTSNGAFAEDVWKAKHNLTTTFGLRWDNFGNPYPEPYGGANTVLANFFFGPGSTQAAQVANGVMRRIGTVYNRSINVWSPRVGVAWDPKGRGTWAVRGGFGVYHDWMTLGADENNLKGNPPGFIFPSFIRGTTSSQPIFALGTSSLYPFGYPYPALAATTLDAHGGLVGDQLSVGAVNENLNGPRTYNYSISVEHTLPGQVVASVGYSGSRSYDQLTGCGTRQGCEGTDINRFPADLIVDKDVLTRLNPSFGSIQYTTNGVRTTYNALIVSLLKHYSSRGTFTASYTRSSGWWDGGYYPSQYNISQYWQPTLFDASNRFSFAGTYSLGAPKFNSRIANYAMQGWEFSSTTILQSGYPFTIYTSAPFEPVFGANGNVIGMQPGSGDYNADGYNYDFPNTPSFGYNISNTSRHAYLNGLFPASAFPVPAMGTEGNLNPGRYRGPGYADVDLGIIKNNQITERVRLQLRFDCFNLFNRPNLNGVDGNLADSTFGQSTSVFNPRWVQFGANLSF
jgi:hypothetical protein